MHLTNLTPKLHTRPDPGKIGSQEPHRAPPAPNSKPPRQETLKPAVIKVSTHRHTHTHTDTHTHTTEVAPPQGFPS